MRIGPLAHSTFTPAAPLRAVLLGRGLLLVAMVAAAVGPVSGQAGNAPECPQGVIGRIEIDNRPVFPTDADDPRLLRWAFGTANLLHVETTRSFIRRELLFAEGDCFDPFLLSESRRLLEEYGFIEQVRIEAADAGPGVKTVQVQTRDRWSTQVDLTFSYDNGLNLERFQATERNFLGNGITAQVAHRERRETQERNFRLFTPRFFGRTDADVKFGRTRGGAFLYQRFNHGFLGETSRFSGSEIVDRSTGFYSYSTGGSEAFSHVLVPMYRERFELATAVRLGDPGRSWIVGLSFDRTLHRQDGLAEVVQGDDFDGSSPGGAELTPGVSRQTGNRGATRLALHLGTRRFRYEEYIGLDAMSERQVVPLGFFGGVSVGRSLGILLPDDVVDAGDTYGRLYSTFTAPVGSSVVHLAVSAEGAHAGGAWRDILGQADAVAWGRARWLPGQVLFFRASTGAGWRTTLPFQLSLGGREGVRSLRDDQLPGGRRLLLVAEDRIRLPWPRWKGLELGATAFADAGRMWAGDAPYGHDAGWVGSVGFGLRIAVPSGSRIVWRPEIAFPVGHGGPAIFRIAGEVNRIRSPFRTPRWMESRRFVRGPEEY
ncbi:MAG TPA: hypothetical protein VJ997_07800 [Longimicrobiales bacterium]|nr:hypothetical protein [Longimicrobiales bacterium]